MNRRFGSRFDIADIGGGPHTTYRGVVPPKRVLSVMEDLCRRPPPTVRTGYR